MPLERSGEQLTQALFEELLARVKEQHETIWSKEKIDGAALEAFRKDFQSSEFRLAYLRGLIQKEIFKSSDLRVKKSNLVQEGQTLSDLDSWIFLYFRGLAALGTLKAQVATAALHFSPLEFLNAYALFVPYDVYWRLGVVSEIQGTQRQDCFSTYEVTNFKFNGAEGLRLNLNPSFLLSSEVQYLARQQMDQKSLLRWFQYVAFRNLNRQWSWNHFLLNTASPKSLSLKTATLKMPHSLELLPVIDEKNDELLMLEEAKSSLLGQIKKRGLGKSTFEPQLLHEQVFRLAAILPKENVQEDSSLFDETRQEMAKRLKISDQDLFLVLEAFLKKSALTLIELPEDQLQAFASSLLERSYGALLFQRSTLVLKEFLFVDSEERLDSKMIQEISEKVLEEQGLFRKHLEALWAGLPPGFGLAGKKFENLRAFLKSEQRKKSFQKLIKLSVQAATGQGAALPERWTATLLTLKNLCTQELQKQELLVPKEMEDFFASLVFVQSPGDVKAVFEKSMKALEDREKVLLLEKSQSSEAKTGQSLRTLPEDLLKKSLEEIKLSTKSWTVFAQIFGLHSERSALLGPVLEKNPEEWLRTADASETARRMAMQRDQLAETQLEPFPLLLHPFSEATQKEDERPLYLRVAQGVKDGQSYQELVALLVQAIQRSQQAIQNNLTRLNEATALVDLDDLVKSPTLNQELSYFFPEYGLLQRLWIDDISTGSFHKRYYEAALEKPQKLILLPLMAMLAYEFLTDGVRSPAARGQVWTLRRAAFQNWREAIHPLFWVMVLGNVIYRDSTNLHKYGLGYGVDMDWEKFTIRFVPSKIHQQIDDLFLASSAGHALVNAEYFEDLSAQMKVEQIGNHVTLLWDALLVGIVLRSTGTLPVQRSSNFGNAGTGWGSGGREPLNPGPPPRPGKFEMDLKTGEVKSQ